MAMTYEPIATTTVGTATASITFSGIPQTFTDLRVVINGSVTAGSTTHFTLNNDTTTLYSATIFRNAGSSRLVSDTKVSLTISTGNTYLSGIIDVLNYSGSGIKNGLVQSSMYSEVLRSEWLYRSTTAISTITLTANTSTWAAGTIATLYGIKAA